MSLQEAWKVEKEKKAEATAAALELAKESIQYAQQQIGWTLGNCQARVKALVAAHEAWKAAEAKVVELMNEGAV